MSLINDGINWVKTDEEGIPVTKVLEELTWAGKPSAAAFGKGQAWFRDIGAMGYSDGVNWVSIPSAKIYNPKFRYENLMAYPNADLGLTSSSEDFTKWSTPTQVTGGTVTRSTVTLANDTSTIHCPLGGSAYEMYSASVGKGYKLNTTYAFIITVSGLTGSTTRGIQVNGPSPTAYIPIVANGTHVVFFTYPATDGCTIRVGSGINYAVAGASEVCDFTITQPMIVDMTGLTANLVPDYVRRWGVSNFYPGNTVASNIVTRKQGLDLPYPTRHINHVFFTGDSLINEITEFPVLLSRNSDYAVGIHGYPSQLLSGVIAANYDTNIAEFTYDAAVIEGGINDIDVSTAFSTMQTALLAMCDKNDTLNIPTFLCNVTPYANITANATKYALWKSWNLYLEKLCATRGYTLINIRDVCQDPSGIPDRMNPLYITGTYTGNYTYTGDVLHPNLLGSTAIMNEVKSKLDAYRFISPLNGSIMSN